MFARTSSVVRACLLSAHVFLLTAFPTATLAQSFDSPLILSVSKDERLAQDRRLINSPTPATASVLAADGSAARQSPRTSRELPVDSLQRLAERLRPLQDRLREDDRLRRAGSLVGLGMVAYGAFRNRPQLPLTFVGAHALRFGLHRELSAIRERSGYLVEPSVGHKSFVITFHRTFD